MNITVLAENSVCTTNSRNVKSEHGISLLGTKIQTMNTGEVIEIIA